ncbi:MAG: hypothetical protein JXX14_20375 [Deltaproteobacteria bacterium]|nr:hypothetical protein [Deltaproteobacteria bacterium]
MKTKTLLSLKITVLTVAAVTFCLSCNDSSDDDADKTAHPTDSSDSASSTDTTTATDTSTTADTLQMSLIIPDTFDCVALSIAVNFFDNEALAGMPTAFGARMDKPEILSDESFFVTSEQAGLQGDYYIAVVVYCEGGGNGLNPVAGVDWVGKIMTPVSLGPGTGTIQCGDVVMVIAQ